MIYEVGENNNNTFSVYLNANQIVLAMGKLKNIKLSNVWFIFVFNSLVEGWWWMCELKVSSFFTSVLFTFCGLQNTNNWALYDVL